MGNLRLVSRINKMFNTNRQANNKKFKILFPNTLSNTGKIS